MTSDHGGEDGRVFHAAKWEGTAGTGIHDGYEQECNPSADEAAAEPSPEQLCFALDRHGRLITRYARLLWATRAEWDSFPVLAISQLVPIKDAPPIGSLPLISNGAPDVVGRVIEVIGFLEKAAEVAVSRFATIEAASQKAAESLSGRVHERELLNRAAALLDEETAGATPTYEQRLNWLSKYREVIDRG